jgi:hypothetical protein
MCIELGKASAMTKQSGVVFYPDAQIEPFN